MNLIRIYTLTFTIFFLLHNNSLNSQYDCSSATIISSLPFSASSLTTSTGASFEASGVCSTNYQEKDYILKYTPSGDENISISLDIENNNQLAGIYIFGDCSQPPMQCLGFAEDMISQIDLSLIVTAGQDYYIFIGTETTEDFDISISKEEVQGVAINKAEPTQTLDVNGAIRISNNSSTPYAGTIRYNEDINEFEGYNGTEWVLLSQKREFGQSVKVGLGTQASDGEAGDKFGTSVSISGDYAVIGSPGFANSVGNKNGKAYVFKRSGSSWIQEVILAPFANPGDHFGHSVAISGDYIVVGSPYAGINQNTNRGKVHIFKRTGTSWTQTINFSASDGMMNDEFGISVAISGDYAVVGSHRHNTNGNNDQGKAYVFKRTGTSWAQESTLMASDGAADDYFGISVSISGDYVVVGSHLHNTDGNDNQGKAYVFKRTNTTWAQESALFADDGAIGDLFGFSVSISGDYVIVSSHLHNSNGNNNQGKAYIFKRTDTSWAQEATLLANDGLSNDQFSASVSISGDYAIIGSYLHDINGIFGIGKAYVFRRSGTSWIQEEALVAGDGEGGSNFGLSVAISSNNTIVGSLHHDTDGNQDQGKVYFY